MKKIMMVICLFTACTKSKTGTTATSSIPTQSTKIGTVSAAHGCVTCKVYNDYYLPNNQPPQLYSFDTSFCNIPDSTLNSFITHWTFSGSWVYLSGAKMDSQVIVTICK